jgi:hypothetical protein
MRRSGTVRNDDSIEQKRTRRLVTALAVFVCVIVIDLHRIAQTLPRPEFGDEWRYLYYARNLLHGFYSPHDRVFLANGPAYPLFLVPFVKFAWIDGARYANAAFHAGALTYAWLILEAKVRSPWSFVAVGLLGLYFPTEEFLPLLYTEVLCSFLVVAWTYHALRIDRGRAHVIAAGLCLGVLALTKVIFGYVLVAFLLIAAVGWRRGWASRFRAHTAQAVLAFALCVPYLGYTYSLTGKVFYWSSVGANSFYWLTTPYPDEFGDWYHQGWVQRNPILRAHHLALFEATSGLAQNPNLPVQEQLLNLSTPETAEVFAQVSRRNVREHPLKFAKNWLWNLVRLFLDVPVSVRGTPFWNPYSQAHLLLLGFTAFVLRRAWRARVGPAQAWLPVFAFALLGMAAYSLSSAVARFLYPLIPLWWLGMCSWLARITSNRRARGAPASRAPHTA